MFRGLVVLLLALVSCTAQVTETAAPCNCNKLEKEITRLQAEVGGLVRELNTYKGVRLEESLTTPAEVAAHLKKLEASIKATRAVEESLKPSWIGSLFYWVVTLSMLSGAAAWGATQFGFLTPDQIKEYVGLVQARLLDLAGQAGQTASTASKGAQTSGNKKASKAK